MKIEWTGNHWRVGVGPGELTTATKRLDLSGWIGTLRYVAGKVVIHVWKPAARAPGSYHQVASLKLHEALGMIVDGEHKAKTVAEKEAMRAMRHAPIAYRSFRWARKDTPETRGSSSPTKRR